MLEAAKRRIFSDLETLAWSYDFVLVPGFKNSDPEHWQSHWETFTPVFKRIALRRWDEKAIDLWMAAIARTLSRCDRPAVLIGHSLGAIAACSLPESEHGKVAGLMIVAPPEPSIFYADDFVPTQRLYAPSLVVASDNDPLMSIAKAEFFARRWGARFIDLGEAGHINSEAGFGPWIGGIELLCQFVRNDVAPLGEPRRA